MIFTIHTTIGSPHSYSNLLEHTYAFILGMNLIYKGFAGFELILS